MPSGAYVGMQTGQLSDTKFASITAMVLERDRGKWAMES